MSRITGKDAFGLFEAYKAVYIPQELSEEKVWEEVEEWVNSLLEEGYDLSGYTWEDMYDAYIEEARAEGVKSYQRGPTQAEVRANAAKAEKKRVESGKDEPGYSPDDKKFSDWKLKSTPSTIFKRKTGETETVSQRMDREKPYGKRMTGPLARRMGSRAAANVDRVVTGAGEPQAVTYPRKASKVSKEVIRKEHVDVYDLVLSHLLDEGYATSVEAAEKIMVNMSEQWIDSICERVIVTRGTSTNAAGQQIPWTHSHNTATGRSSVEDKFGKRDSTTKSTPDRASASIKAKTDLKSQRKGAIY